MAHLKKRLRNSRISLPGINVSVSNVVSSSYEGDVPNLFAGIDEEFDVSGWDVRRVKNLDSMFRNCNISNLDIAERKTIKCVRKIYKPKTTEELKDIISRSFKKGKTNLNDIDTSLITDMSKLFIGIEFNFDISDWNTKNVKNMESMFWDCTEFNCDISKWDVRKVKNMRYMFWDCQSFNQDIGKWNLKSIEDTGYMFCGCPKFNQDISKWDVRSKKDCLYMFCNCINIREEWKPKYFDLYWADESTLTEK